MGVKTCIFRIEKERTLVDLSLTELENKVFEITKKQNYMD